MFVTPSVVVAVTNQIDFIEYDQIQLSAWRERFEEELKRHGVEASPEEKEKAFNEYLIRIKERVEKQKEIVEGSNTLLILSGRVVDQDGNSVPNADVGAVVQEERMVGLDFYRLQTIKHHVQVRTDAAGNFTLDGGHGRWISIQTITAPGYLFLPEQQNAIDFYADDEVATLKPSAQHINTGLATFQVWRQQGETDMLIIQDANLRISPDGKKHLFNLFRPRGKNVLIPAEEDDPTLDGDILFEVLLGDQEGSVRLRLEAVDGGVTDHNNGGFIAPIEGYASAYDVDISTGDQQRTVFVRTRNGQVYTRMTLNAWYDHEKKVASVGIIYSSNTQGRPNLQPGGEKYQPHRLRKLMEELRDGS